MTASLSINPNGKYSEPLRLSHVPFKIISDHPGIFWPNVQRLERKSIDALVRLPESNLAFNKHCVEKCLQTKPHYLASLSLALSVRKQRQSTSAVPKPLQRLYRVWKQLNPFGASFVIDTADLPRQLRVLHTEGHQRESNHFCSSDQQIQSPHSVPLRIRPEPIRGFVDCFEQDHGVDPSLGSTRITSRFPASLHASGVIENGVIQIEKDGPGQWSIHFKSSFNHSPCPHRNSVSASAKGIQEKAKCRPLSAASELTT